VTPLVVRMVRERFHRDLEGRPIREGRTPAEYLKPDDIEYKKCPYAGGRLDHANPMNVSALRQTSAHWSELLDALAVLRTGYVATRRTYKPDVMDLWRVSQLGSALPWLFILRDEPVPAYVAALSKATLGVGIWAQQLLMRELAGVWTAPLFTAANMTELAEETGTLIGTSEVCSGSEKMILRFFEVYVDTAPGTGELVTKCDEAMRFGAHYAQFKLLMWIYYLARRYLYWDLGTPEARALLETGCEPPDFFILEPPNAAHVAPPLRMGWFARLAQLVVPFAADGSDAAFAAAALRIAAAMGEGKPPAATFATLDQIFTEVVTQTEAGIGGDPASITAEVCDSLIADGTRTLLTNAGGA
jgi:hypothetical protein